MARLPSSLVMLAIGALLGVAASAAAIAVRRGLATARPHWTYADRLSLFNALQSHPGGMVFAGDSLTANGEWAELLDDPRARNRGVGGETVAGLQRRVGGLVAGRPAVVFVMIGINDVLDGSPAAAITSPYEALLSSLRAGAPEAVIVVQSTLPIGPPRAGRDVRRVNAAVLELNAQLREVAAEARMPYVDVARFVAGADGALDRRYTTDGVHLNGAGYLRWAEAIRTYLASGG